jgi:hypothetical protein
VSIVRAALVLTLAFTLVACGSSTTPAGEESRTPATEVIDPAKAETTFVSLWNSVRAGQTDRLEEEPARFVGEMLEAYAGLRTNPAGDVLVGVPRGQASYPAYFVATANAPMGDDRTNYFICLLGRASEDDPWMLRYVHFATSPGHPPAPDVSSDGYLADLPAVDELAFDPTSAADRYANWFNSSTRAQRLVTDEVLTSGRTSGGIIRHYAEDLAGSREGRTIFRRYVATPRQIFEIIPLVDGTLWVPFSVDVVFNAFNNNIAQAQSCADHWLVRDDDGVHYQTLSSEERIYAHVLIPSPGETAEVIDNVSLTLSSDNVPCP